MYIIAEKHECVEAHIVTDEEILKKVFEICPQVVFSDILSHDFFNYVERIPEYCNSTILEGVANRFQHIIDNNFIEIVKDGSFDYDYGGISSTHYCTVSAGYVPRTPEFEEMSQEDYWDEDGYYYY